MSKTNYKNFRGHMVVDIFFVILIIILVIINIYLFNKDFSFVDFEAKTTKTESPKTNLVEEKKVIDTKLILSTKAIYYTDEGEQLGLGPWPPVVDKQTSVRILVNLVSDFHEIKNLQLKIKLAKNIKYIGRPAVNLGEAVLYDEKNHFVYWHIESLKAGETALVNFEIEFTPSSDDLGKKVELMTSVNSFGTDAITLNSISSYSESIYSEIVSNEKLD